MIGFAFGCRGLVLRSDKVAIIGAGIGGLAAAALLGARGFSVTVIERQPQAGGKMRELSVGADRIDGGPTVLTLPDVFAAIFDETGAQMSDHVTLRQSPLVARHAWNERERLDLFADEAQSLDAVARFAGPREAEGYKAFAKAARRIFETLEHSFLKAPKVGPPGLMRRVGLARLPDMIALRPYESLWSVLGEYFRDPRLRQLFGRYATYCGSSPFQAPATLMLIAHVEAKGVWMVDGGPQRLAEGLERVARAKGVEFRFGTHCSTIDVARHGVTGVTLQSGERIEADWVIANADPQALAHGAFGAAAAPAVRKLSPAKRSLSALVWTVSARTRGFPLARHNVFLSGDYAAEFRAFARGETAAAPSAYVCALDREAREPPPAAERLQIIVNAPARGDTHPLTPAEIEACEANLFRHLGSCGLTVERQASQVTTPSDFAGLFPSTGGALYGPASHGWLASFLRPASRTRIPRLYLAGGATHPGAGVPMAALSGRLAADTLTRDRGSTGRYIRVAMPGGTSMR